MEEKVTGIKRITSNFKHLSIYDSETIDEFRVWKQNMMEKKATVIFDRRNCIYCVNPTMDYEMYYNYVVYLNSLQGDWVNQGYFDCGLVPYMMWPSFMDASPVLEQMRGLTRMVGINLVSLPPLSLLRRDYGGPYDYWIYRDDLYNLMQFMSSKDSVYSFNVSKPDDACLSKFLEPLANMTIQERSARS